MGTVGKVTLLWSAILSSSDGNVILCDDRGNEEERDIWKTWSLNMPLKGRNIRNIFKASRVG